MIFDRSLPPNAIQAVAPRAAAEIPEWARLQRAQPAGAAITFDTQTGKVSLGQPDNTLTYTLGGGGSQLSIMPNFVVWHTSNYVRWTPFLGEFSTFALRIIEWFLENARINAVKFEYWDRFVWTGVQADMDPALLLRPDLDMIAQSAIRKGRAWHSHCGWFEPIADGCRRLTNVNLNVVDMVVRPNQPARPTIGIYTMLQDDCSVAGATPIDRAQSVSGKLDGLHLALKRLLQSIISQEMAERISLHAGAS